MEYFTTNENIKIPAIVYGTAWKKQQTARLVEEAILNGFRGVDTACQPKHYQEDLVGDGLLKAYNSGIKREDLYIQTKFTPIDGQDPNNMPYSKEDSLETQIQKSFQRSKENLKTKFIDSYVLHSPVFPTNKLKRTWSVMESFYESKEVGQLGISNCYDLELLQYLYEFAKVKPAVVQNRFYGATQYDKEIRDWCNEKGIIYQSFWSLTANIEVLNSELIISFCKKYSKTQAQIFYRYLHQLGIVPLIGTTDKEHMQEDMKIFEFELTSDEINKINNLLDHLVYKNLVS